MITPTIRRYLQQIGRKGGSVKGPQKRTKTSGKVAADARWAKPWNKKGKQP
jgi:hypothetical protein